MRRALGLDVGGTRIKVGVVDDRDAVDSFDVVATHPSRAVDEIVEQLAELAAPAVRQGTAEAIGLAIPGLVERSSGLVRTSPNFPSWQDVPLGPLLKERLGVPVFALNDASAATWGETQAGAGRGCQDVAGFTLGTGVGGGLVLDGALRTGASGLAAEFGHLVVDPGGRPCGCGGRGCLEQLLGVDALRTIIAERADAWSERAGDSDLIEALCVAARAGDPLAVEPLERAGLGLGHAIASVALVVDIETVILMGGLSGASDLLIPWAQTGIRERIYSLMADRIHIVQGALGDRAGVVGAAIWAMDSGS